MYINSDIDKLPISKSMSLENSKLFHFPENTADGCVIYDPKVWSNPPIEVYEQSVFIISGWFIYKQQLNPLALLAQDITTQGASVLNNILAGVFVLYWKNQEQQTVFTDALGLSTHYIDKQANTLRIAPSVKALVNDSHKLNETMQSILNKKNHLFGNFTLFDCVERLSPGTCITTEGEQSYFKFYQPIVIEDLGQYASELTQYWQYDERVLPLSSGLDSRYLLANSSYKYGFTYGPENSPERQIAGNYQQDFQHYLGFDYSEQPLFEKESGILDELAFGTLKPINRLLTNYRYVASYFPKAQVFFDGYLGDLFQRGTYINFKGKRGEVLKLFPFLYSVINLKAKTLMRLRYKELTGKEFTILWQDFVKRTDSLALTDYQKVTYYEFLYGRGGRYTIFGSNILAAQFFTVVSPFATRGIFDSFIQQNYGKAVSYNLLKKLWLKTDLKYKGMAVESGYSPSTNPLFIPFIQLVYRGMFHLFPSRANYGVKQKRMEKNNK